MNRYQAAVAKAQRAELEHAAMAKNRDLYSACDRLAVALRWTGGVVLSAPKRPDRDRWCANVTRDATHSEAMSYAFSDSARNALLGLRSNLLAHAKVAREHLLESIVYAEKVQ